jgi:transposase-like protein
MSKIKINLDEHEIIRLYTEENKTIQDICLLFGVNYATIKLRLIKSGIKLRTTSESKKIVMNRPEVKKRVSDASKKSQHKRKETNILKYGTEVPASGINWQDNYKKEYGVRHPNQTKENRERFGGENNPSKKPEAREKIKENRWEKKTAEELKLIQENQKNTWLNKLGVDNPLKSETVKQTIRTNSLEKRGVDWPAKDPVIREKLINIKFRKSAPKIQEKLKKINLELITPYIGVTKKVLVKCIKCNNQFETILDYVFHDYGLCKICYPHQSSVGEGELKEFVSLILPNSNLVFNDRKLLDGLELDILIPEKNIAIEFDGIYYHSEKHGISKSYHLIKTENCLKKGIRLVHIFEDEWLNKKEIVKSRLKRILNEDNSVRIHARQCEVKEINSSVKDIFLNNYHIQGKDVSLIRLGAFYNDVLVSVMTFSKGNISKGSTSKEGIWELNRFCSDYTYHIPGIASKLLEHFKKNYEWMEIFSYCDRRWSEGKTYYNLGFTLDKITKPNYWYIKGVNRIHRFNLRKRKDEPKNITELELRDQEGFYRIWDCGNFKFTIKK